VILKSYTTNNGYGCSCCSRTYNDSDWIDEFTLPSFEEVVGAAFMVEPCGDFGDTIYLVYEGDGKIIYGYDLDVRKGGYTIRILIGDQQYTHDETGEKGLAKDQLLSLLTK
jgi:hypothetical protein